MKRNRFQLCISIKYKYLLFIDDRIILTVKKKCYFLDRKASKEKQPELLEKQRKLLLNTVHKEEKKIYGLDYLMYQIKK